MKVESEEEKASHLERLAAMDIVLEGIRKTLTLTLM